MALKDPGVTVNIPNEILPLLNDLAQGKSADEMSEYMLVNEGYWISKKLYADVTKRVGE